MSRILIIDGYNAISKIKEFDVKKDISLETARLSFIRALAYSPKIKNSFDSIIIVFDGRSEDIGMTSNSYGAIKAIFTNKDHDADNVIVSLLKKVRREDKVSVCSDDNFVRNHAKVFSADIIAVTALSQIISLKRKKGGSIIEKENLPEKEFNEITKELKKCWGID